MMKVFSDSPICRGCGEQVPSNYSIIEKPGDDPKPLPLSCGFDVCILCADEKTKALLMDWTPEKNTGYRDEDGNFVLAPQKCIDEMFLRH